jgi:hypothetical protein
LFLLYITDFPNAVTSPMRLFADDATVLKIFSDPNECQHALSEDLQSTSDWFDEWRMGLSPTKTEGLDISFKPNHLAIPPVMSGHPIEMAICHRHLGLTFNNNANWSQHLESICKKSQQKIGIIRSPKYKFSRKVLHIIYKSFIRPDLENASVVWDGCGKVLSDRLEAL